MHPHATARRYRSRHSLGTCSTPTHRTTDAHASAQPDGTFSSEAQRHPLREIRRTIPCWPHPALTIGIEIDMHRAHQGSLPITRTANSLGADMCILRHLAVSGLAISTALLTVSACDRLGSQDPAEAGSGSKAPSATPDPSPTPTTPWQLSKLMRSKMSALGSATVRLTGYEGYRWSSTYRIDCRADKLRLEFHKVTPGRGGQPARLHYDIIVDGKHFYSRISNWKDPNRKPWYYGKNPGTIRKAILRLEGAVPDRPFVDEDHKLRSAQCDARRKQAHQLNQEGSQYLQRIDLNNTGR